MPRESVETIALTIRDTFVELGEVYGQQLYNHVKKQTAMKSNYGSFRANYINPLKKTGLILPVRTEPSIVPGFQPRQYWKINHATQDDLKTWRNPREALKNRRKKE